MKHLKIAILSLVACGMLATLVVLTRTAQDVHHANVDESRADSAEAWVFERYERQADSVEVGEKFVRVFTTYWSRGHPLVCNTLFLGAIKQQKESRCSERDGHVHNEPFRNPPC